MSELLRPPPPRPWRDRVVDRAVDRVVDLARCRPGPAVAAALAAVAAIAALAGFLGARVTAGGGPSGPDVAVALPQAGAGTSAGPTTTAPAAVVVHVSGAVARPGLVELRPGARVADAVDAAGGPSADAELDRLNLAAPVVDGTRVHVPRRGEPDPTGDLVGGDASPAGPLDLNAATLEQLDALPGVGPATAEAILEHRRRRGRFRAVRDLLDVPGIGEARFARLRDLVRV